ncbi:MAG: tRNA (adenosine(37)-N6)-threonylcarbamoyltransferase complex ATPase subunit type 1 TsaE [Balneolales bacterium]|nr:tRNA (adenosine(37)-N6)-threonylcarbamoyltransferase complex ATPase subunit type 1 TsaE [Balneolales bacterium]
MKLADVLIVTTNSPEETHKLGITLSALTELGDIICLHGDLGAGKTALVKGVAEGLGINPTKVNSPTFTLIHEYTEGKIPVYHFDAYRLKSATEALEIGTEEYLYGDGISLIEWPEKMESLIPPEAYHVYIEKAGSTLRTFKITPPLENGHS